MIAQIMRIPAFLQQIAEPAHVVTAGTSSSGCNRSSQLVGRWRRQQFALGLDSWRTMLNIVMLTLSRTKLNIVMHAQAQGCARD
jgi:hypothetical protein